MDSIAKVQHQAVVAHFHQYRVLEISGKVGGIKYSVCERGVVGVAYSTKNVTPSPRLAERNVRAPILTDYFVFR